MRVENNHVIFFGSERESVKTCVFAGFLRGRRVGPPMPPYPTHLRYRQCFLAFYDTFHVRTRRDFFLRTIPLRGRFMRARPVQNSLPRSRASLSEGIAEVCRSSSKRSHRRTSPSNQSLTSASEGFCRNRAGKSKGQEGLGSVTIASNQVAMPTAHGCKPIL